MKLTSLLWLILAMLLANCQTTASSGTAEKPHPDLPANYRQQIAEFMRTQLFARAGIKNAEISDPRRAWAGLINGGNRDTVCVRLGGPIMGEIRGYYFVDGKLSWDNGGTIGGPASGVLLQAMACGENPNYKPFPEADYQPRT